MQTQPWTFETASACWQAWRLAEQMAADDDLYDSAEAFILARAPTTPVEADTIFAVLIDNGFDRRADGLDVRAIENLKAWVGRMYARA